MERQATWKYDSTETISFCCSWQKLSAILKKECVGCAAGVFSAPVALPLLVQVFEEEDCLENLPPFISGNAQERYTISPPEKHLTFVDDPWQVPESYGDVRPFYAGRQLRWSIS